MTASPRVAGRRLQAVERLEPRIVLDADALPWGGDAHLTLSFAPDGTSIAGSPSALFAKFDALAARADWQASIAAAFQTWAAQTNAAIGVVADGGQPFGVAGATRRDSRFGDIRLGAAPLDPGVMAIAIPADNQLAGAWIGDVIFNSAANFASLDDLYAVSLHEAGHVFGLEHSDDPSSPMHIHGITPAIVLTPGDVAALRALHGEPQADLNELDKPNDAIVDATHLDLNHAAGLPAGSAPSIVYGKISGSTDVDYFRVEMPAGYSGSLTFRLRTQGVSLLAPRLTVRDANGVALGAEASTQALGDELEITIANVEPDARYYAAVDSPRADSLGVGDYALVAVLDALNVVPAEQIESAADGSLWFLPQDEIAKLFGSDDDRDFNDDEHGDDDEQDSVSLESAPGFAAGTRYQVVASVADAVDVDFYKFESPNLDGQAMTLRVRSLEAAGLIPRLTVRDDNGDLVPVEVLVNGGGEIVAQLVGVDAETEFTVSVGAADPGGPFGTGNYQLTVGFGQNAIDLPAVAAGTLTPAEPTDATNLYIGLPQLFHVALRVDPAPAGESALALVRIYDANNQLVHQLAAPPGETRSAGAVLLKPGTYRVAVSGLAADGVLSSDLSYTLLARAASDPFVGDPDDPTFQPVFECPDLPGFFCYPGDFISPNPFLWEDFLASLAEAPDLTPAEQVRLFLADWWTWVWQQAGENGPPLALTDAYLQLPPAPGGAAALTAPLNVLANDLDPEHDTLTAVLETPPAHGTLLLLPDGTVDYTADAGFVGVDVFTYRAFDFIQASAPAMVRISVGLRGDADADRDVDGADFLAWQRTLGAEADPAGSNADFDGNGAVESFDRLAWSDNFGVSLGLAAAAAGDYDADGAIEGRDFLAWQRAFGGAETPGAGADGNGDGQVSDADLGVWAQAFGGAAPAQVAALQVAVAPSASQAAVSGLVVPAGWTVDARRARLAPRRGEFSAPPVVQRQAEPPAAFTLAERDAALAQWRPSGSPTGAGANAAAPPAAERRAPPRRSLS